MIYVESNDKNLDVFYQWCSTKNIIGLDTETTGLDPYTSHILLLQIGDEDEQWIFNVVKLDKNIIKNILSFLNTLKCKIIIHNAKFDYKMIKYHFGINLENIFCTLIATQIISGGDRNLRVNLQDCLKRFLNITIFKETRESFINQVTDEFDKSQLTYAATDVKYLPSLYIKLMKIIKEKQKEYNLKNLETLVNLEMHCVKVTANLELNGIYLDKNLWLNLNEKAKTKRTEILEKLNSVASKYLTTNLFGEVEINFDSNIQVKKMLETILNEQIPNTSNDYLESIKDKHECIPLIIEYRKISKLITTYGEEFLKNINPVTNRIHSSFKQIGAETGRFSSDSPNLQNIPATQEYRDPFCAQNEDYRIISADFSSQELLILTYMSQEDTFIKAINENKDLHAYSASILFNIDYEKFFKYKEDGTLDTSEDENGFDPYMKKNYRNKAKSITFGLMYGIGPKKLSNQLNISYEEAKSLMEKYFEKFPKIKQFMQQMEQNAIKYKIAISELDGRFRSLNKIDFDDISKRAHALNQAKNMPIQSCGASMTKLAMILIQNKIDEEKLDAKLILTVHDEILVECHKDIAEKVQQLVKDAMNYAFNYYIPTLQMKINPRVDTKWVH